ncbi:MAG: CBS domain-containing protein [Atopostipes sp.]|nr:CBS domain-containing protein [Atopostipes sp.]
MTKADEFVGAYNKIDHYLKKRYGYRKEKSFTRMIRDVAPKDSIVRINLQLLESYAELRNAIVHNQDKDFLIADPHEEVVEKIKKIAENISNPPRVNSLFNDQVLAYDASNSVFDAIKEMTDHNYSQMPIKDNEKFLGLLNANTITRWFGATENKEIDDDGSTIITDTKIKDVLDYKETTDTYRFISRNTFIHDALDYFEKDRKLEALFITETGDSSEKLLGIITVWDLFKINEALEV